MTTSSTNNIKQSASNEAHDAFLRDLLSRVRAAAADGLDGKTTLQDSAKWVEHYAQRIHELQHPVQHDIASGDKTPEGKLALLQYTADTFVIDFCNKHHLTLRSKKYRWRKCSDQDTFGIMNAMPRLRGQPRITNGILAWCEREDGSIFECHLEWLQLERTDSKTGADATPKKGNRGNAAAMHEARKKKAAAMLKDLID